MTRGDLLAQMRIDLKAMAVQCIHDDDTDAARAVLAAEGAIEAALNTIEECGLSDAEWPESGKREVTK